MIASCVHFNEDEEWPQAVLDQNVVWSHDVCLSIQGPQGTIGDYQAPGLPSCCWSCVDITTSCLCLFISLPHSWLSLAGSIKRIHSVCAFKAPQRKEACHSPGIN